MIADRRAQAILQRTIKWIEAASELLRCPALVGDVAEQGDDPWLLRQECGDLVVLFRSARRCISHCPQDDWSSWRRRGGCDRFGRVRRDCGRMAGGAGGQEDKRDERKPETRHEAHRG